MGGGIAEVCAKAGVDTVVVEVSQDRAAAAKDAIEQSMAKAVSRNKLDEVDRDGALGRLTFATDMSVLADRDLVVEAIVEDLGVKKALFHDLDQVVKPEVIIATNTSTLPVVELAMVTQRPEQVCGIHFFNPAPMMRLVEVIRPITASDDTVATALAFAESCGKDAVEVKDRAGFVVNALLIPYILSAIRMMESGFATADDIDHGMVEGCNHPMGPLALADLIGLDTTQAVAESLYEEFKEPLYAAPPLLSRMVEAGVLGRKTGRGFFEYPPR